MFVDTPGFQTRRGAPLDRTLNRAVHGALADVDVLLFVVEAGRFGNDDEKMLALLKQATTGPSEGEGEGGGRRTARPVILVANKLDAVRVRADLAPWLQGMQARHPFTEFVPLSARRKSDAERLLSIVEPYLPLQPWLHEEDALTDRSERFLAGELIREKLFRQMGDELPYTSTVVIDRFEEEATVSPGAPRFVRIAASIVVERDAHKGMVIGAGGERLKRIGADARVELQSLLDARVFLELWVKVRSGWADDEAHLRSYGYE